MLFILSSSHALASWGVIFHPEQHVPMNSMTDVPFFASVFSNALRTAFFALMTAE